MDPISALGAVSSAIGIASFAIDLSVGLFKLASQVRSASNSLKGVGETVRSTAFALEQVEDLLRKEEQHVQQGKDLRMFSAKGLARVKETTDQCLIILWRIEAVAVGCEEPEELEISARLASRSSATSEQAIMLDPRVTTPPPGIWNRLVFAVSASDKLGEYGKQLQNLQISLGLIFNVVTVTYLITQNPSSLTDNDRKVIETAKENLHRPQPYYREAAQVVLAGINSSDGKVDSLPQQRSEPDEGSTLLQGATAPVAATNMLWVEHPGLVSSSKPRITRSFNRFSSPSPNSGATSTREIGFEEVASNDEVSGSDHIMTDGDTTEHSAGWLQSSVSSRSATLSSSGYPGGVEASLRRQAIVSNPMKVYSLQKQGNWRQQKLSQADIMQRLAKLDLDPMGVLDKKLKLPTKYQTKIDDIHEKVNMAEARQDDFEWSLRQLELKNKRFAGLSLGHSWGLMAIIVYLEREARQYECVSGGHDHHLSHTWDAEAQRGTSSYNQQAHIEGVTDSSISWPVRPKMRKSKSGPAKSRKNLKRGNWRTTETPTDTYIDSPEDDDESEVNQHNSSLDINDSYVDDSSQSYAAHGGGQQPFPVFPPTIELPQQGSQQAFSINIDDHNVPPTYDSYECDQEPSLDFGQTVLPQTGAEAPQQGSQQATSINIDFAPPPLRRNVRDREQPSFDMDVLTPPDRGRRRQRAVSDPYARGSGRTLPVGGASSSPNFFKKLKLPLEGRQSPGRRRQSTSAVPTDDALALRLAEPEQGEPSGPRRVRKHPATFQCNLCSRQFTRAYNLRSHLRTHTRRDRVDYSGEASPSTVPVLAEHEQIRGTAPESELDDDLIKQLTLLLTPMRNELHMGQAPLPILET